MIAYVNAAIGVGILLLLGMILLELRDWRLAWAVRQSERAEKEHEL